MGKRVFSSVECPNRLWRLPSLLFNGYRGFFPGVKRTGRQVNHSPPSSDDIKNKWSCTTTTLLCLNGVDREKSTFAFLGRFATNMKAVKID